MQAQFTPLHLACQQGHNQSARLLLMAQARSEARNSVSSGHVRAGRCNSWPSVQSINVRLVCVSSSRLVEPSAKLRLVAGRKEFGRPEQIRRPSASS